MPEEALRDEVEHVESEESQLERERQELEERDRQEFILDFLTYEIMVVEDLPYKEAREKALQVIKEI